MRYPIKMKQDGRRFVARIPDVPEVKAQGDSADQARDAAREALVTAFEGYLEKWREVPEPSRVKRGRERVELAPSLAAKVLLVNEMVRQRVRPTELARRMQVTKQEVSRLTDLRHTTKIDGVAEALKALGKTLDVRVS